MNRKLFPVLFSVISSSALEKEILSKYKIKKPFSCQFYTQGLNDIYIVKTPEETYYLRISVFNWRTEEEIKAEIELLKYLEKNRISIAIPVHDNEGKYIHKILAPEGVRYAVLFKEARGQYKNNPSLEQNFKLGNMIAKIHTYTDKIKLNHNRFNIDQNHLIDEPLKIIRPYMSHREGDYKYLEDISYQLITLINNILPKHKPYYGICHGDIHHGNIRFSDDNLFLFDFDCFGYGWRAYDISVYLWHQQLNQSPSENEPSKQKQWDSFLEGYNNVRKLNNNELDAIKIFVIIREIWLLGINLGSLDMNRGCDWLNDGYFDFHLNFIKKWLENNKHIID